MATALSGYNSEELPSTSFVTVGTNHPMNLCVSKRNEPLLEVKRAAGTRFSSSNKTALARKADHRNPEKIGSQNDKRLSSQFVFSRGASDLTASPTASYLT